MRLFLLLFLSVSLANAQGLRRHSYTVPGAAGGGGGGVVVHDTQVTAFQQTGSSATWSHTVSTAGSPAIEVFVVLATPSSPTVTSVTYGGDALTLIGSYFMSDGTQGTVAAYGLAGCKTGANNVVVTLSDVFTDWDGISVSQTGVASSGAFDGFQSAQAAATSVSVTVTTGDPGDMVIDCVLSTSDNLGSSGAGQTQRWQDNSGVGNTQGSTKAGAASVTMTENWDNNTPGHSLIAFNINHN